MTCTHRSRLYLVLLCFLFSERCWSAAALSVKCMIINLQYVECTWHPKTSEMNYTFSSAFKNKSSYKDCPEYILGQSYTIGCRIPLKKEHDKFAKFYTNTYIGGNKSVSQDFDSLQRYVQLNSPYNLSVVWFEQNSTLVLQWKNSTRNKCAVYMVHQQTNTNQEKYTNVTGTSYSPSHISPNKHNVFRVRSTVSDNCGPSDFWSNWSATVEWGTAENITRWQGLLGILPVLLLLLLVSLLCYCERKKILLPIVPDPSKNLQDLFRKHDGNVESWVYISKELKEAFEPDYTEPSCDVCEVTPPCDVSATPVATPTSEADTCDRTNSEEMPAKQLSL
ncbi:interleukin 2 receptor, gamma b [Misgurnus anguillicaudatus]|uniref:interleukin 2 receptor, gamma b n=1 Tax=Misgurnus anguillicaudatus TaxID=75329 RepID=UPI003CCF155B